MMKKAAVLQSNYIPWKGYFDMINSVDVFVLYDIVQYSKNAWINRNQVIIGGQPQWLTIPVRKISLKQPINQTRVSDSRWASKHWKTISQNYLNCDAFEQYADIIGDLYQEAGRLELISEINYLFITTICRLLGVDTQILMAESFTLPEDRQERLIEICRQTDCDIYVSGPAAKCYIEPELFVRNNTGLEWFAYDGYPDYKQKSKVFMPNVSIVDLLLNMGNESSKYIVKNKA
ncbi:MAG: hypothetical protein ACI8WB_002466 [Phenylobacterium sp.]|jgi:hypothetical protein